ncbi:MAG: GntR family transcriptional regulator [Alphaproteobacteria bacterium]|nr:GntR family transcriptional regulator [Alphaproteobacteria bacterium]
MRSKPVLAEVRGTLPSTLCEAAAEAIRNNIVEGKLAPGVVLQESALSERLSTSRATVKRALSILADEGRIRRFDGRGFLVAGDDTPRRLDLRSIDLNLDGLDDTAGQPNWLRIQDEVAAELSRCLVFGRYRVIEATLARDFDVSRTVIRDVLSRLQERGLVQKKANMRWIVEPLTARRIKDKYEMRIVLEIAALKSAEIDIPALADLAVRIRDTPDDATMSPEAWFDLDNAFLRLAILSTPNVDLAHYVSANRSALEASQRVLFSIGLPPHRQSLLELCMVIDLLLAGTARAAANMMATHLQNALNRTIAQLKIVSVIDPPTDLADYLVPD